VAEEDDGAEKSQEPTEKRKEDAREEGQVLTSKEALGFAGFAVGTGLMALAPALAGQVLPVLAGYFRLGPVADLDGLVSARIGGAFWQVLGVSVAVAAPMGLGVVAVQVAIGGLHWPPKALGFKGSRIDPLAGLKRMVSGTAAVELGKAVAKVVVLGAIAWAMMAGALPGLEGLWAVEAGTAASVIGAAVLRLMWGLTLGLAGIAVLDLVWQVLNLRRRLMMTLHEDGGAPVVVAKGVDHLARRIREIAADHEVPLVENRPLARSLYDQVEIDSQIPPEFYRAVAEIIHYLNNTGRLPRQASPR